MFRIFCVALFALRLAPGLASSCEVPLNNDKDSCLGQCMDRHGKANYDVFVCDLTKPWLHHYSANPEWLPATPPAGTGKHEYAVFQGGQPPCAGLGKCPGCESPAAKHLCSVFVDPKDCSVTCSVEVSSNQDVTEEFKVDEMKFQMEKESSESSGSDISSTTIAFCFLAGVGMVVIRELAAWAIASRTRGKDTN